MKKNQKKNKHRQRVALRAEPDFGALRQIIKKCWSFNWQLLANHQRLQQSYYLEWWGGYETASIVPICSFLDWAIKLFSHGRNTTWMPILHINKR